MLGADLSRRAPRGSSCASCRASCPGGRRTHGRSPGHMPAASHSPAARQGARQEMRQVPGAGRGGHAVGPGVLAIDEALELTSVEEDAATLGALVDMDAAALVGAHVAVAFGAGECGHHSTVPGASGAGKSRMRLRAGGRWCLRVPARAGRRRHDPPACRHVGRRAWGWSSRRRCVRPGGCRRR